MGVDSTGGLFFSNSGSATKTLYLGDDDNVGIGESSPSAQLHVNDDTHDITAKFVNSNAGNSGANVYLIKDSSSPASGDNVGVIQFRADDDAGNEKTFASITAVTEDASAGSSDGSLRFGIRGNASTNELMRITSSGLHIGGTGSANALDDYEEGTWTPTQANMNVSGTFSASGRYVKVGKMVLAYGTFSATGSIAYDGSGLIGSFPFQGAVTDNGTVTYVSLSGNSASGGIGLGDFISSRFFFKNDFTTTGANQKTTFTAIYEAN